MKKNKFTASLATLGVLGISTMVPSVYAADSAITAMPGQDSEISSEKHFGRGLGFGNREPGEFSEPGRLSERGSGSMTEEEIQEMSDILANNDFSAFLEKMSENRPENAPEPTVEQIERMQEHFDHMVELYNDGKIPRFFDGGPRRHHDPFGKKILMENKGELSVILENNDFDAFLKLVEENKPANASEMTDEMIERLERRFEHMVERYKNGEMPWQQDQEVEND